MHREPQPVESQLSVAIPFWGAADASAILRIIPAAPGVFALYGPPAPDGAATQPYLSRAADLRRRIGRLLAPAELAADGTPIRSKRLNLRDRIARIEYTVTGSEWESVLVLYRASTAAFGAEEARRRLRLHTPYCVRFTAENAYPRLYVTNRLSRRGLETSYGPFPSRAAAERYTEAVLDLFQLRRCYEELTPAPDHPGCIYGEMHRCLAPCQRGQTPAGAAEYSEEAAAVRRFLDTRGESMVVAIGLEREEASAAMQFERAAELHAHWQKVRAVQALADELVAPVPKLRALVLQHAAPEVTPTPDQGEPAAAPGFAADAGGLAPATTGADATERAAAYLVSAGCLFGPQMLSTLGVRAVREQTAVGSSLFAQPLMLEAVPLVESGQAAVAAPRQPSESPEARAAAVIARLEESVRPVTDLAILSDHLSILRRWYYRPEKQRSGEAFLPDANGQWPLRRILNGAARVALGTPGRMAETQRELAERNPADAELRPVRTKVLHEGRPDVERVVPVIEKPEYRSRRRQKPAQP